MKYVDIKIEVGLDGKYEAEVIGRSEDSSCLSQNDAKILRDLLAADSFGEIEDDAPTKEYWTERQEEDEPECETAPFKDLPLVKKEKGKDLENLT